MLNFSCWSCWSWQKLYKLPNTLWSFSLSPKSFSLLKQTSLGTYANAMPFIVSGKCQNSSASVELGLETEKWRALSYQKSPLNHGGGLEIAWKLPGLSSVSCWSPMLLHQYNEFIPTYSFHLKINKFININIGKYLCCVIPKLLWKKKGEWIFNLKHLGIWTKLLKCSNLWFT